MVSLTLNHSSLLDLNNVVYEHLISQLQIFPNLKKFSLQHHTEYCSNILTRTGKIEFLAQGLMKCESLTEFTLDLDGFFNHLSCFEEKEAAHLVEAFNKLSPQLKKLSLSF